LRLLVNRVVEGWSTASSLVILTMGSFDWQNIGFDPQISWIISRSDPAVNTQSPRASTDSGRRV
jgi:hypothetical protein